MLKLHRNLSKNTQPIYRFVNNHSVDFDGVDDFIQLNEPISYTQHTISTWVKASDTSSSKTIIDARDSANDGWRIVLSSDEIVNYQLNSNYVESPSAISVDEWHHIVGTYDGTTQKLYIDGSLVDSTATEQEISTTTNAEIGSRNFSDRANEFAGKIDELAIFDRALEEEEVTKIYRIKYGANLVQNGNFDELGSELVTNGDYSNGLTGWTASNSTLSIENSALKITSTGGNRPQAFQNVSDLVVGKTYKLSAVAKRGTTLNGVEIEIAGISSPTLSNKNTTNVFETIHYYFVATATTHTIQAKIDDGSEPEGTTAFFKSVSLKQVDPNDRWTLNTGWSYGDGIASCDGTQSSVSNLETTTGFSIQNKTLKVTFDLVRTAGNLTVTLQGTGSNDLSNLATSGTYTFIATSGDATSKLIFKANVGFIGSITNVMLEQQKYVATNLKLNSIPYSSSNLRNYYRMGDGILDTHPLICDMVQPSLGSDVINNGTFNTDLSNWTPAGTNDTNTITYENGAVRFVSVDQNISISQFNVLEIGKIYKLTCDVDVTEGAIGVDGAITEEGTISMTNGFNEIYFTAKLTTFKIKRVIGASNCLLDNVAVKKVNGVPGMMTNMAEADITNDVPG